MTVINTAQWKEGSLMYIITICWVECSKHSTFYECLHAYIHAYSVCVYMYGTMVNAQIYAYVCMCVYK